MEKKKYLRILEVTPSFYPARGYGGASIVVYQVAKRLVKKGHQVTVYATDADEKDSRLESGVRLLDGIKVYYFQNLSNSLAYNQKLFLPLGILSVARKEVREFDIIRCHDTRTFQNVIAHHYARRHSIPYVLQPHGATNLLQKKRMKRLFDILFGNRILKDASAFIAISRAEAAQLAAMGVDPERIVVVPNAVELSEFHNLPQKGAFKRKWGIAEREKIVFFLGRIHPTKGLDLLAEAFAEVAGKVPDARLVVAGIDDGYLSSLKKLVSSLQVRDKVLFPGPLYGRDKLEAYVDAEVFFSHSEHGSPLITFLEAWACGVPVVTTDVVDLIVEREKIHGQAGYVIPYNKQELAQALQRILADDGLRKRMGEEGRRLVEARFDWDAAASRVEELYYDIVTKKGQSSSLSISDDINTCV